MLSIPGRQQLIDIIAVLRRPQAKADLDPRVLSGLSKTPPIALLGAPDRSLIRFAATTPWGERFGGATAAGVEAGTEMQIDGAGRSFAGGSTQTRYVLVVPDGVARVKFSFPAQAVTVPVRGNVAAVQVDRQCCAGQPALIWYSAGGRVIKRIAGTPQFQAPQRAPGDHGQRWLRWRHQ